MQENSEQKESSRFEFIVPMKPAVLIATALVLAWLAFMAYETTNMMPPILEGYPGDSFFPRIAIIFPIICYLCHGLDFRHFPQMQKISTLTYYIKLSFKSNFGDK